MRQQVDRTGLVALAVAVVCGLGMVVAVPSLLPAQIRDLVGLGPERLGQAPNPSGTGPYRFLQTQPASNAPVGYNPCERIGLRVNLDGAPPGSLDLVLEAASRVEKATGLRFDFLGTSDLRPQWEGERVPVIFGKPRTTPVLVSWANDREVGELAGRVAGLGGSVAVGDKGGTRRYVTGGITLDSEDFAEIDAGPGGKSEQLAILLHEFGHLVGLDHVQDEGELMNAENVGRLDFGPGDLLGLSEVGKIACS